MQCRLSGASLILLVHTLVPVPYSENGYEDRITLIRGKLEEVQLPVDKVGSI